jgi:RNA polymerase sigma-70 factor, ECF subfamily
MANARHPPRGSSSDQPAGADDLATDEELAAAACRGNTGAYDTLVRRYLRPAMALAWQFTGQFAEAEDVVQDSFHRLVRSLPRYDPVRPFRPWFFTIVRNTARSALAKQGRRDELAPLESYEENDLATQAPEPGVRADLTGALEALAPMQRACVRLCDLEGFTSGEAAAMLGLAEGTVRTHLFRARGTLRNTLSAFAAPLPKTPLSSDDA